MNVNLQYLPNKYFRILNILRITAMAFIDFEGAPQWNASSPKLVGDKCQIIYQIKICPTLYYIDQNMSNRIITKSN